MINLSKLLVGNLNKLSVGNLNKLIGNRNKLLVGNSNINVINIISKTNSKRAMSYPNNLSNNHYFPQAVTTQ